MSKPDVPFWDLSWQGQQWANLTRYCLATASGTTALFTSLNALDVGPGDEVIVPSYTFVATVNAVFLQHALPVYVDTDRETFQINANKIEAAITARTKCILPVHLGGSPVDMLRYDQTRFAGLPRDKFLKALAAEGIPNAPGYAPLNKEPFMKTTLHSRAFMKIFTEWEKKAALAADLDFRSLPVTDFDTADLQQKLPECVKVLDGMLKAGHTVCLHCTRFELRAFQVGRAMPP